MKLKDATALLEAAGIESAREEARIIFSELGDIPHYKLLSPEAESNSDAVARAVKRRASREPLGYVLGEVDFFRERYKVTPDCLIPRPDTEILVDTAIKNLPEGARFLDLCTGSGCVALSVLNNSTKTSALAVDISHGALLVARENSERLGLSDRVEFLERDVLSGRIEGDFYALISNPPYVTNAEYDALEKEIYFEPRAAFLGGEDGGDFYRALTALYRDVCKRGGFIAYEIGYNQGELLRQIAKENLLVAEIIKDLGGRDRVALLRAL